MKRNKKKVKIKFVKDRPGHDFRYAIDNSKIKRELKWKATSQIEDLVKDMVESDLRAIK